ncbi:uncharacterized protein B0I36DRAFT_42263 [Microdochium trichocladiopsis]|uniref:Uncharacterized protein n=1 Tax=Microdochium trichocladiopsis TaxID=1682393 RepID=A0A9P9BJK6_9PEZI|nr:uncharacterized protein B0I36DRAFT_42263 [Microdochium trichocladiopsis]KAH7016074.1 hypothetical protein B0I36DRAFT_42263 [Microdochium trichocladiopsis]
MSWPFVIARSYLPTNPRLPLCRRSLATKMNTISFPLGPTKERAQHANTSNLGQIVLAWLGLPLSGGGAYYFAKKGINADRAARLEERRIKKAMIDSPEYSPRLQSKPTNPRDAESMSVDNNERAVRMDTAGTQLQTRRSTPSPANHGPAT